MEASNASSNVSSFISESNRILHAMDDTERGVSHDWKNVQPAVVHSTKQLHHGVQQLMSRMESLENKMDQILVAVSTLTHDRQVKEERYASDNRAFTRAWSQLQETVDQLRSDFERTASSHHEAVRVLRDLTIPELERELDAVKEVHRVQSRKEHRIEQLEKDEEELRRRKVDADEFASEIRSIRAQMEQMALFPAFKTTHRAADGSGHASCGSSWSDGVVSMSRWLWHGGSFGDLQCSKAIPWTDRMVRVGEATRWSKTHPHVVKVDREGIYRISLAVFHNNTDISVPTLSIFVNNDAVINALSSASTFVLRRGSGRPLPAGKHGVCTRCRVVRCCCDPDCLSGLTVNDMLFLPAGCVITVGYQGDPRNVTEALLELQCLC